MLSQRQPQVPVPGPSQIMLGRCMTCTATVRALGIDCQMLDDPPLGKYPFAQCPNERVDGLGKKFKCGCRVCMYPIETEQHNASR